MSFTPFDFTKNWENPADFPTYEENEEQVRADIQLLYDELKVGLNNLMSELEKVTAGSSGAGSIGVEPLVSLPGVANVMDAISAIMEEMADIQAGAVLPNSVTETELADDAVTTPKLNAGAVTTPKIANEAVTEPKTKFTATLPVNNIDIGGKIILGPNSYGTELPANPEEGRLFFLKVGSLNE